MTTNPPPAQQWTRQYAPQTTPRSATWPTVVLATVAAILSAAALIVALVRPANGSRAVAPTTMAPPTYTAAETTAAHQKLCDVYKLAARAVQIETNGDDPAMANISTVNGAQMLQQAVNTAPALAPGDRAAALELAEAYSNSTAVASFARGRDDPAWRSASDNVIAKDARMKAVCSGG
ncbi:hypothetical protein PJK45_29165 [Mycobacterium kansasii]|nr:hypothetical protein [Mycobacterium kansasii]ARG58841.1 hypothetical protein B1T43_27005 [Mycobacterium kansasii]ARG64351.1 hypothetical protein B1T45_27575 [Mycobacterium kansasii]ARG72009.1 hypothetical protein B1T47_26990 [Mycobacterium kansasii]ARG73492.1 hypothetical protein B1T51_01890 [Mycobacterium kansasii]ARG78913.1 hypothetical protein B1T52_01720 [Mycobacterium kansasii]